MGCLVSDITTTVRVNDVVDLESAIPIVMMFQYSHTVGILLAESDKLEFSPAYQDSD